MLVKDERLLRLFPAPKHDIKDGLIITSPELETETLTGMLSTNIKAGQRDYPLPDNLQNIQSISFKLNNA